jgi:uroporphyrinogen-III decarboxylase
VERKPVHPNGGVDTQKTLPFGSPADVWREVTKRLAVFGPGGRFVFNPVHNVQAKVPVENLRALFDTVREHRAYR